MSVVVPLDSLNARDRLIDGRERYQAVSDRLQDVGKPGFLHHNRTSTREVACASLTEPAAPQPHVLIFGDGELSPRGQHIISIGPWIHRKGVGIYKPPPVREQHTPHSWVDISQTHCQLQPLTQALWEINELEKFVMLAPKIGLPAKYDVPSVLPPVADRRELAPAGPSVLPNVQEDRLARPSSQRRKGWQWTVGRANVLPIGDKLVVLFNKCSDVFNTIGESDLMNDRIGAEIYQSPNFEPFFSKPRGSCDIQHDVGMGKKLLGPRPF